MQSLNRLVAILKDKQLQDNYLKINPKKNH